MLTQGVISLAGKVTTGLVESNSSLPPGLSVILMSEMRITESICHVNFHKSVFDRYASVTIAMVLKPLGLWIVR